MRVRRMGRFAGPNIWDVVGGGVAALSTGNLAAGLAAVYDTIEIRTSVTPPAVIDLHAMAASASEPPSPVTQFLKPTLILTGRTSRDVIAPYGEADGGWGGALFGLAVLVGFGFVLGRASK